MKEKISIKNFSVLKDIELEINKLNIFIGEQATGKSLIAKLVQYFQQIHENISNEFLQLIHESNKYPLNVKINNLKPIDKNRLIKNVKTRLLKKFNDNFPKNLVLSTEKTEVTYFFSKHFKVKINTTSNEYSINFPKLGEDIIYKIYCEFVDLENNDVTDPKRNEKNADLHQKLNSIFFAEKYRKDVFISEERGNHLKVERYSDKKNSIIENSIETNLVNNFKYQSSDFDKILKGKIGFDRDEDYNPRVFLENNQNKLFADFFSSGQKALAAFPIVFSTISNLYQSLHNTEISLFIEEPETHIFPSSQKDFIEILCEFYNELNTVVNFVIITTHSPYILTSLNNLIQADNTFRTLKDKLEKKEISKTKYDFFYTQTVKVIDKIKWISFEDISVYSVENGLIKDLKNYENRMIDADVMDEVSNKIMDEFSQLIDIENGEM